MRRQSADELLRLAARNHELEQTYHSARTAAVLTRQDTQRELRERVAQAFIADPAQRAMSHPPPTQRRCCIEADGRRIVFDGSLEEPVLAKTVALEATRRFRADQRAKREENLQERAKQLALHEEKRRFVAEWIAKHGTDEQQARQAAGVLPMAEAVEAIADQAFAPAASHPRYVRDGAAKLQELLRAIPEHSDLVVALLDVVARDNGVKTAHGVAVGDRRAAPSHLSERSRDADEPAAPLPQGVRRRRGASAVRGRGGGRRARHRAPRVHA